MATTPSIPSASVTVFAQSWAPVGWTRVTSNYDNYALRITSTSSLTPFSGGTEFSSVFSNKNINASVTISNASMNPDPGSLTAHSHPLGPNGPRYGSFTSSKGYYARGVSRMTSSSVRNAFTTTAGSSNPHTHTINAGPGNTSVVFLSKDFTINYIDVILARRN